MHNLTLNNVLRDTVTSFAWGYKHDVLTLYQILNGDFSNIAIVCVGCLRRRTLAAHGPRVAATSSVLKVMETDGRRDLDVQGQLSTQITSPPTSTARHCSRTKVSCCYVDHNEDCGPTFEARTGRGWDCQFLDLRGCVDKLGYYGVYLLDRCFCSEIYKY